MVSLSPAGGDNALTVRCSTVLGGTRIGDSISVNGVCLTVTGIKPDSFSANLQPVTLRLSNLGELRPGSAVNLERSVPVGGRFGGHYVQGHVDGVGRVVSIKGEGKAVVIRISAPGDVLRYVVERGFVSVDGASLTVMELHPDGFSVSLVYHTQQNITLPSKPLGAGLNLEADVVAKYVERLIAQDQSPGLDMDLLRRAGYA